VRLLQVGMKTKKRIIQVAMQGLHGSLQFPGFTREIIARPFHAISHQGRPLANVL
jgi:hypothetical protein